MFDVKRTDGCSQTRSIQVRLAQDTSVRRSQKLKRCDICHCGDGQTGSIEAGLVGLQLDGAWCGLRVPNTRLDPNPLPSYRASRDVTSPKQTTQFGIQQVVFPKTRTDRSACAGRSTVQRVRTARDAETLKPRSHRTRHASRPCTRPRQLRRKRRRSVHDLRSARRTERDPSLDLISRQTQRGVGRTCVTVNTARVPNALFRANPRPASALHACQLDA